MAMNNRDRVGKAFDLLSEGLLDEVDEVMTRVHSSSDWPAKWAEDDAQRRGRTPRTYTKHDVQVQLRAITEQGYHFKDVLSRAQQGFASELRETRNLWAHNEPFSSDDRIACARHDRGAAARGRCGRFRRGRTEAARRSAAHGVRGSDPQAGQAHEGVARTWLGLRPWRGDRPHDDVARGAFTASEFAADLHLVHTGQATGAEYGDPVEFFTRTYVTEGLRDLLSRALRRLNGEAGAKARW